MGPYLLFLVPIGLFVVAFLYETYLSFMRLKKPRAGKSGYVNATWEVTHTLLVFGVVMLIMLYTQDLEGLASTIFLCTFLAAAALIVRAIFYIQIFYVRSTSKTTWVDWGFALSHVVAALFLVITLLKALWYLFTENPPVNDHFIPAFIPGLILVLAVCAVPMLVLYKTK